MNRTLQLGIIAFFLIGVSNVNAQRSSGTLFIKVNPEVIKPGNAIHINLIEKTSRGIIQTVKVTSADEYPFHDLP
ncbi:MAG: hypothetical protein ABI778_05135, partial [Ignavibacteriota bacterium]